MALCVDCGHYVPGRSRCDKHEAEHNARATAKRGTTHARGYGFKHQRLRAMWQAQVDKGQVICAECRLPISPGSSWDLGHTQDRTGYIGPTHAKCNRSEGGSRSKRSQQS